MTNAKKQRNCRSLELVAPLSRVIFRLSERNVLSTWWAGDSFLQWFYSLSWNCRRSAFKEKLRWSACNCWCNKSLWRPWASSIRTAVWLIRILRDAHLLWAIYLSVVCWVYFCEIQHLSFVSILLCRSVWFYHGWRILLPYFCVGSACYATLSFIGADSQQVRGTNKKINGKFRIINLRSNSEFDMQILVNREWTFESFVLVVVRCALIRSLMKAILMSARRDFCDFFSALTLFC